MNIADKEELVEIASDECCFRSTRVFKNLSAGTNRALTMCRANAHANSNPAVLPL